MAHISGVFMGCFPCDTRLEAFPPYLSRVRSLARLLSFNTLKKRRISASLEAVGQLRAASWQRASGKASRQGAEAAGLLAQPAFHERMGRGLGHGLHDEEPADDARVSVYGARERSNCAGTARRSGATGFEPAKRGPRGGAP